MHNSNCENEKLLDTYRVSIRLYLYYNNRIIF